MLKAYCPKPLLNLCQTFTGTPAGAPSLEGQRWGRWEPNTGRDLQPVSLNPELCLPVLVDPRGNPVSFRSRLRPPSPLDAEADLRNLQELLASVAPMPPRRCRCQLELKPRRRLEQALACADAVLLQSLRNFLNTAWLHLHERSWKVDSSQGVALRKLLSS